MSKNWCYANVDLYALRGQVFLERTENFHWKHASYIGLTSHTKIRNDTAKINNMFRDNRKLVGHTMLLRAKRRQKTETVGNYMNYQIESFVVMKAIVKDSKVSVLLGKVLSSVSNHSKIISKLQAHRVGTRSHAQRMCVWYMSSFHDNCYGKSREPARTYKIFTGRVMIRFSMLKVRGKVSISDGKLISRKEHISSAESADKTQTSPKCQGTWSSSMIYSLTIQRNYELLERRCGWSLSFRTCKKKGLKWL